MKFSQLRLAGFKSFIDPTELRIDPGLTGVIGPNGCGKSNLLEALRWVMGATSAKSLRGGGMEDVIFAGTDNRPARERAEVTLTIDNSDHRAPARFNDADILEVVRKITRGKGSDYTINGEDVRAKDVQLLFADAGTGANSPALVRQGQISELINAKPENRRRVLEEAAGVSGLRARRREAQLRLNAAEANLERLQEVIEDLDTRYASLQRQARQASRYRTISQDIRAFESLLWLRRWSEAVENLTKSEATLKEVDAETEKALVAAAVATREAEAAVSKVQPLRDAEAEASAALRLAERTRDQLDRDVSDAKEAVIRLRARIKDLGEAESREAELHGEAKTALDRLKTQTDKIHKDSAGDTSAQERAEADLQATEARRREAEAALDAANTASAQIRARRDAAQRDLNTAIKRCDNLQAEAEQARQALTDFSENSAVDLGALENASTIAAEAFSAAQATLESRAEALEVARTTLQDARDTQQSATSDVKALTSEKASLERLLASGSVEDQVLDAVRADAGFEQALAAALGDDLEAGLSVGSARRWGGASVSAASLPEGAIPLCDVVEAPDALSIRLAAVGVVDTLDDLDLLVDQLEPGQRLVTRDGALHRWDGYAADAGAPSATAVRLETRNRVAELDARINEAEQHQTRTAKAVEAASIDHSEAERAHNSARQDTREAEAALRQAERSLSTAQAEAARAEARRAGLAEALERAEARLSSARTDLEAAEAATREAQSSDDGSAAVDAAREAAEQARAASADQRAQLENVKREAQGRRHRLAALEREAADWQRRETSARERLDAIRAQIKDASSALSEAEPLPEALEAKRPELLEALEQAEAKASAARDAVSEGEIGQREADSALRVAEKAAAEARESRAAAHARLTAARERLEETVARLRDATGEAPETLQKRATSDEFANLSSNELERRLDEARLSRERLGAVNLRADEESQELDTERTRLKTERDDLVEAVARLRKAVDTLSREGRARLLEAFEIVDGHFRTLFATLFDGGRAELALTESDDPLEAGLEIYACPPGKKMETMSLMSGGEQALTATALIFAVFLSNPAPVCVLDEVDAPLDDANVDRYCTMLEQMRTMTDTRFLVITHNPVTMSRMDRLFGVTMGERGVSQLVSVSLNTAEAMLAAE